MTLGSLFAGIGGIDLGFERAGFKILWQVELNDFCQRILKRHFPGAERHRDIRDCGVTNLASVDCISAGVPCQDVSVAGKRAGLTGQRTGLFFDFARVLRELRPAWFVFENVPGLFSSNRGRDFAEVLRVLMVECGYGLAWRVLDSQFFGVAQRRRRLFIVGCFGRPCPPEVLFERAGGGGNPAAGAAPRADVAYALAASVRGTGDGHGNAWNTSYAVTISGGAHGTPRRSEDDPRLALTIRARHDGYHDGSDNLIIAATLNSGGNAGGFRSEPGEHIVLEPLRCGGHEHLAVDALRRSGRELGTGPSVDQTPVLVPGAAVRRLTPVECERLQGFPDGWTLPDGTDDLLPPGLDSVRCRALGNAVTVPVAQWIASRILVAQNSGNGHERMD